MGLNDNRTREQQVLQFTPEGVSPSCLRTDCSHLSCSRFTFYTQSLLCPPNPTAYTTPKGEQQKALQGELCLPSSTLLKAWYVHIYIHTQQQLRKAFTTVLSFPCWCLKQKHTGFSTRLCYTWYSLEESNAAAIPPTLSCQPSSNGRPVKQRSVFLPRRLTMETSDWVWVRLPTTTGKTVSLSAFPP